MEIIESSGADITAQCLKKLGVTHIFGVVGIPVFEVADCCAKLGIRFIGFRNEQAACYAASAWGFLSKTPGVCLTVSGPGFLNAVTGIVNSMKNSWPVMVISGSCKSSHQKLGGFQEFDQVGLAKQYTKGAFQPCTVDSIPESILTAWKLSIHGRAGPVYIDLMADIITGAIESTAVDINKFYEENNDEELCSDFVCLATAASFIMTRQRPLLIIGDGAAYERCEEAVTKFVELARIPFIALPMAKGVVADEHKLCANAARSFAMENADLVLVLGARVDWMLHFGSKFNPDTPIIQLEAGPEWSIVENDAGKQRKYQTIACNLAEAIKHLTNEAKSITEEAIQARGLFMEDISCRAGKNVEKLNAKLSRCESPLDYYTIFGMIRQQLPGKYILVSEGANTLDIGRTVFNFSEARCRLDSGTFGTMGIGLGYAIAAQIYYPKRRVIAVVGDSAFGFSGMEIETAIRGCLPIIVVLFNNNGIYDGVSPTKYNELRDRHELPCTALTSQYRYDLLATAGGGLGFCVSTQLELREALQTALDRNTCCIINCIMESGNKSSLNFAWNK